MPSDWASDGYIEDRPNGDVLLNSIAWLAVEESSIGIRPKDKKFEPIHFAGANNWMKLGLILLLVPSALLLNAFLVWREKKRM